MESYITYFLNNKDKQIQYKPNKKNNLSYDFDKLFFNFLIIIKYNIPFNYNKHIEKNIKYEIAHDMEKFKFKLKNKIIENLCYEDNINLYTLFGLSTFFNKNLLFFKECIYFKMFTNHSNVFYLINENKDIFQIKEDKKNLILEENYELTDINKPIYSITHYKVYDLELICDKIKIKLNEKYKKKELYEFIKNYLINIIKI